MKQKKKGEERRFEVPRSGVNPVKRSAVGRRVWPGGSRRWGCRGRTRRDRQTVETGWRTEMRSGTSRQTGETGRRAVGRAKVEREVGRKQGEGGRQRREKESKAKSQLNRSSPSKRAYDREDDTTKRTRPDLSSQRTAVPATTRAGLPESLAKGLESFRSDRERQLTARPGAGRPTSQEPSR